MSMLENTFGAIKKSLARPSAEYAEARARCTMLAPYETPDALVAALRGPSALTPPRRQALVAAVVAEHQRSKRPLWQSVLLAAFEPMLVRLRGNAGSATGEDWDQEVLLAFLEAAATLQPGEEMMRALLWLTEAKLKRATRRDRRAQDHGTFNDATYCTPFRDQAHAKLATEDVMQIIEKRGGPELLTAVLATGVEEETLTGYVARAYPDASPAERASRYKRLFVARSRVLAELRVRAERASRAAA
jgi:hypothetical protein